jgi:hypothetical protein
MRRETKKENLQQVSKEEAARMLHDRYFAEHGLSVEFIEHDIAYYAWPEVFGSTAGPFGGCGGASMTTFQLEAWEYQGSAVLFCQGKVIKTIEKWQPMSMRSAK